MTNQNRLLGDLERVESRAIAAVRHVNSHSGFVHAFDDGDTEVGNAFISSLGRTIADQISCVVSELRNALAKASKEIDIIRTAEVFRILQSENDADLAGLLDAF